MLTSLLAQANKAEMAGIPQEKFGWIQELVLLKHAMKHVSNEVMARLDELVATVYPKIFKLAEYGAEIVLMHNGDGKTPS